MAAEERVLTFLQQQNRPYNAQGVADHLAQYGVKKTQAQKALDTLSEANTIVCKEFGKTKIYMAVQDDGDDLTKEELEALQQQTAQLAEKLQSVGSNVQRAQKELKDLQCSLTAEQIQSRIQELKAQWEEANAKLATLKSSTKLVTAAERSAVEKAFAEAMDHWAKRKRMFRSIWDQVSENIDQNVKELWEEIGVESDEVADVDLAQMQQLLPKRTRR
ncbi:Homologous-pairing protein 2 homolog [Coccomyxa sp. Obi]|nr:Homologous-pairing protein 2 homolog [Coccomyxa sp. Obi]